MSVRKRCPLFLNKAFVAITSVSLKIELENQKWQLLPALGAPGVPKGWRPEVKVNGKFSKTFYAFILIVGL